jgi:AcrR family transcriptional regulator
MKAATPKVRKSETRKKLIDAALVVAARDGLGETNVKSIAREAGVTPGLLHYHFASKDDVLFAAVERAGTNYVAALDAILEDASVELVLDSYLDFARRSLSEHRPLFALRLALAVRAINEPALAERLARGDMEIVGRLATILARHSNRLKISDRDMLDARMVKSAFEGLMLAWLSRPGFPMEDAFSRFADAVRSRTT